MTIYEGKFMNNREEIINLLITDIKKRIDIDKIDPDFYLYILLLASEMLEVQNDKEYWKNVFYNYVVKINELISKTKYFSLSIIGGLGLLAFCCDNFYNYLYRMQAIKCVVGTI